MFELHVQTYLGCYHLFCLEPQIVKSLKKVLAPGIPNHADDIPVSVSKMKALHIFCPEVAHDRV